MGWTRRLRPTTCAASSATRWNTARRRRRRSTAWPTTRGTRRPTIRSTTGSGGSRNWFPRRARRTAPSPSIRATRRRATAATSRGETETFRIADYTPGQAAALREEFGRVVAAPGVLEERCANRELLAELRPWLAEFRKFGRTRAPDARSHRMLRDGRRRGVLERLRPQPDERRRPQCLRGPQVRHDEAPALLRAGDGRHGRGLLHAPDGRPARFGPRHRVLPDPRHDAEPPDARPRPRDFLHFGPCAAGRRLDRRRSGNPCARFPR